MTLHYTSQNLVWHMEKLPYFIEAVESGSIRKASIKLGISQPSLTRSMQILEECLEGQLLVRRQKGVEVTSLGHEVYKAAKDMLRRLDELAATLQSNNKHRSFRLVTHELIVPLVLSKARAELVGKREQSFHLSTSTSVSRLIGKVLNFEADIALAYSKVEKKGLISKSLRTDEYAFYISRSLMKRLKLNKDEHLTVSQLATLPLILAPSLLAAPNETVHEFFMRHGLHLTSQRVVGSVESVESVAAMINAGYGIGLLPIFASQHLRHDCIKLSVQLPGMKKIGELVLTFYCRDSDWQRDLQLQESFREFEKQFEETPA